MKYITTILVALLVWVHIAPHIEAYQLFKKMQAQVPACQLEMKWNWYDLAFDMNAIDCIKVITN